MPDIVDLRASSDPRDVIHRAVEILSGGGLVAFPTDTLYTVAAYSLSETAVSRLHDATNQNDSLVLAAKHPDEVRDYLPNMTRLGQKLSRRCWPGPVTIEFPCSEDESGLTSSLPRATREALLDKGSLQCRVTANPVANSILNLLPAPLLFMSESLEEHDEVGLSAAIDVNCFGDDLQMLIDDGPSRYGSHGTSIRIDGNEWSLTKQGVVAEQTISRLAAEIYVFVCTGNTCRSPMAEALFRKLMSDRLQCSEEELVDRGFMTLSAGIAAGYGAPASPESVEILRKMGIDLSAHASQPLTTELLSQCDHVYTMTNGHLNAIVSSGDNTVTSRARTLAKDGSDISDPIGGGMAEYQRCKDEIERNIAELVSSVEIS